MATFLLYNVIRWINSTFNFCFKQSEFKLYIKLISHLLVIIKKIYINLSVKVWHTQIILQFAKLTILQPESYFLTISPWKRREAAENSNGFYDADVEREQNATITLDL